jgi:hypothetical protein
MVRMMRISIAVIMMCMHNDRLRLWCRCMRMNRCRWSVWLDVVIVLMRMVTAVSVSVSMAVMIAVAVMGGLRFRLIVGR